MVIFAPFVSRSSSGGYELYFVEFYPQGDIVSVYSEGMFFKGVKTGKRGKTGFGFRSLEAVSDAQNENIA